MNKNGQYVELSVPINNNETNEIIGAIFMSFSIENIYSLYNLRLQENMTFGIVIMVLVVIGAVFLVKMLSVPLVNLTKSIKQITAGGEIDDNISY